MSHLRPLHCLPAIAGFALAAAPCVDAATYEVGPTRTHATLDSLLAAVDLGPGDIVLVDGSHTYPGDIVVRDADGGAPGDPVTIRGMRVNGQRPHLDGGVNTIEFRLANHVVFEGFEVTGGSSRCIYHHSHDLTVRDVVVHDCPSHGILSSDQDSGSLLVEYTEIHSTGEGDRRHSIYATSDQVAYPGSTFTLRYSWLHDGTGGNLLKSRAERNEIYYNWFENAYYHEMELIGPDPNGVAPGWTEDLAREDSDIVGNVIVHRSGFGSILRFGGDATGHSRGRYRFVNNTVVRLGHDDTPTVFRLFDGIESLEAHNNVLWRDGAGSVRVVREVEADWTFGSRILGSNNWIKSGATFVPAGFTGTLSGSAPGFVDAASLDYAPAAGSALIDAGSAITSTPPLYDLDNPLLVPTREAPQRQLLPPGAAPLRSDAGAIDIGAFAFPDANLLLRDGFED